MADPAAGPMPDDPNDVGAADPGSEAAPAASNVLLTVLDNGDGTYTLIKGDEDEGGDTGDDAGGVGGLPSPGGMVAGSPGGAVPGGMGSGDGDAAGAGQSFDSIGALMKGILDCLQEHESAGEGSEDDNMAAGYSGADIGAPTMKQPPAAMRS